MIVAVVVFALEILTNMGFVAQLEDNKFNMTVAAASRGSSKPFSKQLLHSVLVIGHKGNSSEAPENTLAAIKEAFALGVGMVEVDVYLSRDGVPVVMHDETVDRTTNGKGLVAEMTLAQLKTLDAGSWMHLKYSDQRIPTLTEALQAAKGKGPLFIDLFVDGLGRPVAQILKRLKLPDSSVVIGAWSTTQVIDFVRYVPRAKIMMTSSEAPKEWDADYFKKQRNSGITGFEIQADKLPAAFVTDAHAHGMPVYAFTVNDVPTMRRLIEMGVDGIETDVPRVMIRVVKDISRR